MRRRDFLSGSLCALAVPALGFAGSTRKFSARTIDLVQGSNVIDMLSLPTLNWTLLDRWRQDPAAFTAADFQKLRDSGIRVFHPAVALETAKAYEATKKWFDDWNRFLTWHRDEFVRADTSGDLARANGNGKIGILLGMQDANHLRSVDDVDAFHAMGQRLTQITYNDSNRLGDGCKIARDRGLTAFGVDVVTRMNSIGMAIDVSHCGEKTSLDTIAASKKPVLVTHSNCRALASGAPRCKRDEVIQAMARSGGVLGITAVRRFVKNTDPVSVEDVLDHFDHAAKLVGVEHVGLGSDFDLDAHPTYDIAGLNNVNRVYELTEGLVRRGYSDEHISLMLGGNFQRALAQSMRQS